MNGKFVATTEGGINIDPNAWNGEYPWQVRVNRIENFAPIPKSAFDHFISFNNLFPTSKLSEEDITLLDEVFRSFHKVPVEEKDFRTKFPANYFSEDGHRVRSLSEMTIDNWLYNQQIVHGYEKKLPVPENAYCDFCIPIPKSKEFIYIEFWGLEDKEYLDRKVKKLAIYKKHNLKLIELKRDDLENLSDRMNSFLNKYLPDRVKF